MVFPIGWMALPARKFRAAGLQMDNFFKAQNNYWLSQGSDGNRPPSAMDFNAVVAVALSGGREAY